MFVSDILQQFWSIFRRPTDADKGSFIIEEYSSNESEPNVGGPPIFICDILLMQTTSCISLFSSFIILFIISIILSFLSFYHFFSRRLHMICWTNCAKELPNDIQMLYFPFFGSFSILSFIFRIYCWTKFPIFPKISIPPKFPIWSLSFISVGMPAYELLDQLWQLIGRWYPNFSLAF